MPPLSRSQQRSFFNNLIVDDERRFIYCFVPKTGCTSWRSVLLRVMGKVKSFHEINDPHVRSQYRFLSNYSEGEERHVRLRNYTKFMTHREPLTRLVSAYCDKFLTPGHDFQMRIGRKIISLYRPHATNESLSTGSDVTFQEFVRYVLDIGDKNQMSMDPHWRPASVHCQPCSTDYEYYSATETADEDSGPILRAIGAPDSLHLPHAHIVPRKMETRQYFAQIPRNYIERLLKLYEDDFLLFGYEVPSVDNVANLK